MLVWLMRWARWRGGRRVGERALRDRKLAALVKRVENELHNNIGDVEPTQRLTPRVIRLLYSHDDCPAFQDSGAPRRGGCLDREVEAVARVSRARARPGRSDSALSGSRQGPSRDAVGNRPTDPARLS